MRTISGTSSTLPTINGDQPACWMPCVRQHRSSSGCTRSVWTAEELRPFLASAESDELSPLWLVATTTGLRRSELLGSRWQDLDLDLGS
jgi:integrase